jgi:hypothetical protein
MDSTTTTTTGQRIGYLNGARGGNRPKGRHKGRKSGKPATTQIHSSIRRSIDEGTHLRMIAERKGNLVQDVDFITHDRGDMYNFKYTIILTPDMPRDRSLVLLFPNHPNPKKRVLDVASFRTLTKINISINERFKESLEKTNVGDVRFAFAFGEHFYLCFNVTGTLYLAWAEELTKKSHGGASSNIAEHMVPVIINYDGSHIGQAIFLPKAAVDDLDDSNVIPTHGKSLWPRVLVPTREPIFVCEQDTRAPRKTMVETMSREGALKMMAKTRDGSSTKTLSLEINPFESSVDMEHTYRRAEEEEDESSYSEEITPMHRSAVKGQMIFKDGTRALGNLTIVPLGGGGGGGSAAAAASQYKSVIEQQIPDVTGSDCGTHRPALYHGSTGNNNSMLSLGSGPISLSSHESSYEYASDGGTSTAPSSGRVEEDDEVVVAGDLKKTAWDSSSSEDGEDGDDGEDGEYGAADVER